MSYISEAYAGSCTDRFITEDTNIAAIGFMVLFDKGFNVQDLFLSRHVKIDIFCYVILIILICLFYLDPLCCLTITTFYTTICHPRERERANIPFSKE